MTIVQIVGLTIKAIRTEGFEFLSLAGDKEISIDVSVFPRESIIMNKGESFLQVNVWYS